jgi:hypothetical protein
MKRFLILTVMIIITMFINACGATAATPTTSSADIQNTAVVAAMTLIAETQAAIPTSTPLPPTEISTATPLSTDTPFLFPTLETIATLVPTSSSSSGGGDPCANRVLSASPNGLPTKIQIANTTKVAVQVSLYLNETAAHGECGYRAYSLSANQAIVITNLIQGCYNLWAWSNDPKLHFNVASGTSCINNPDKWLFQISTSTIKFAY